MQTVKHRFLNFVGLTSVSTSFSTSSSTWFGMQPPHNGIVFMQLPLSSLVTLQWIMLHGTLPRKTLLSDIATGHLGSVENTGKDTRKRGRNPQNKVISVLLILQQWGRQEAGCSCPQNCTTWAFEPKSLRCSFRLPHSMVSISINFYQFVPASIMLYSLLLYSTLVYSILLLCLENHGHLLALIQPIRSIELNPFFFPSAGAPSRQSHQLFTSAILSCKIPWLWTFSKDC